MVGLLIWFAGWCFLYILVVVGLLILLIVFIVGCGMVIMLVSLWLCVDCAVSVLISVDYVLFDWWFNSVVALVLLLVVFCGWVAV